MLCEYKGKRLITSVFNRVTLTFCRLAAVVLVTGDGDENFAVILELLFEILQ